MWLVIHISSAKKSYIGYVLGTLMVKCIKPFCQAGDYLAAVITLKNTFFLFVFGWDHRGET